MKIAPRNIISAQSPENEEERAHRQLLGGLVARLGEQPDTVEERKPAEPHQKPLPFRNVRGVKVQARLRRHTVVPDELVLFVELQRKWEQHASREVTAPLRPASQAKTPCARIILRYQASSGYAGESPFKGATLTGLLVFGNLAYGGS